jgi:hypothetical protein
MGRRTFLAIVLGWLLVVAALALAILALRWFG